MELGLRLGGEQPSKPFSFLEESPKLLSIRKDHLGFCMGRLGKGIRSQHDETDSFQAGQSKGEDHPPPLQLRLPWISTDDHGSGLDVNRLPLAATTTTEEYEEGDADSSPNSTVSSFQMDFGIIRNWRNKLGIKRDVLEVERASDDDELINGSTRKKLRLSKQQSAFLEESFKEHSTLNPKQKLALAKQLNLRPRQVEVWFQNRRARTKLKQTEVDCEYLKRCCETLTEENKRLQKELQDLRALKNSQPFYMQQSPATTLTMCPSCERVATAKASPADGDNTTTGYPPFFSYGTKCEPET